MAKRLRDAHRRDELMLRVPEGTKFIQVKDELGHIHYRDPHALADTDEIQVTKDGSPIVMKAAPGRRKNIVLEPATRAVAEILRRKEQALEIDPIITVARGNPESPDVLHQIVLALGAEAASIAFERSEAERNGLETSNLSIRRVNALKALGDTWLKRKEQIVSRGIDLESAAFKALFGFIMETFRSALDSCELKEEHIETVFAKLAQVVGSDDWEDEARNRMKNIV